MSDIIIVVIILNAIIAAFVAKDAREWSMDSVNWFLIVFFFSVIGVIIYLLSRNPEDNPKRKSTPSYLQDEHKKCPQCAEEVKAEAKICRFCGHTFPPKNESENTESKSASESLEFPVQLEISVEMAEVYEHKNNRSNVIDNLKKGTQVKILNQEGQFGEWFEVELEPNKTGYLLRFDVGL